MIRLCEDGHEVHVAYMTSGNIAVFDDDARRAADLLAEYNRLFGIDREKSLQVEAEVNQSLSAKGPGQPDSEAVLRIKALIRWSEAKAGAIEAGCREECLHFLDLPFYQTGTIAKRPLGEDDVRHRPRACRAPATRSDLSGRRLVRPARHAPPLRRGDPAGNATDRASRRPATRSVSLSRGMAGMGSPRNRHRRAAQPERPGAQNGLPFSATNRRKTGPCSLALTTRASSGNEPKSATATRPTFTTALACRSFLRLKGLYAGMGRRFDCSMDNVVRNVRDIDPADRVALEHILGQQLRENQQLNIRVVTTNLQPPDARSPSGPAAVPSLPDWCRVYEGLSDQEIAGVEEIALTRANLARPSPNLYTRWTLALLDTDTVPSISTGKQAAFRVDSGIAIGRLAHSVNRCPQPMAIPPHLSAKTTLSLAKTGPWHLYLANLSPAIV